MGAERCFVYAKACGIIARSFVEERAARLAGIASLDEFASLVSGFNVKTETAALERQITDAASNKILRILAAFPRPPALLIRLVKSYEYADVKNVLAALRAAKPLPALTALGRFASVRWSAYPNVRRMFLNTEYQFLLKEDLEASSEAAFQALLDKRYWTLLLEELRRLAPAQAPAFRRIAAEEIALANCSWALRLRSYYGMSAKEITARLIDEKLDSGGRSLARDALRSLDFALDHRSDWMGWRQGRFLNPEEQNSYWKCDPRVFQHNAAVYLYERARKSFRRHPFSLDTAACFIRLKQFEEQILCAVVEALKLGVEPREALAMTGGLV